MMPPFNQRRMDKFAAANPGGYGDAGADSDPTGITTLYNLVYQMLRTLIISIVLIFVLALFFAIAWVVTHINDTEMPGLEDDDENNL